MRRTLARWSVSVHSAFTPAGILTSPGIAERSQVSSEPLRVRPVGALARLAGVVGDVAVVDVDDLGHGEGARVRASAGLDVGGEVVGEGAQQARPDSLLL